MNKDNGQFIAGLAILAAVFMLGACVGWLL
jgi:hypothetical protein